MGKMRHHGTNGKNDIKMEEIPVDLDERTVRTVAKMGDYFSMVERLVLRVVIMIMIMIMMIMIMIVIIIVMMIMIMIVIIIVMSNDDNDNDSDNNTNDNSNDNEHINNHTCFKC